MNTSTKLKVAVVDDKKWMVENLCKAVALAEFEPIPVCVEYRTSLDTVVAALAGVRMVLLDHMMWDFTGEDVAKRLPKSVLIVTTSDHRKTDEYCQDRLEGKDWEKVPFERMAEEIRHLIKFTT